MGLLARGEASAADRAALSALVMRARLQADAVDKALKLAIKTEPALGANLGSPMQEASTRWVRARRRRPATALDPRPGDF